MYRILLAALFLNALLASCSSPSEPVITVGKTRSEVQIPVGYGRIIGSPDAVIARVWAVQTNPIIEWSNVQAHQVTVWCLRTGEATLKLELDDGGTIWIASVLVECHDQGVGR